MTAADRLAALVAQVTPEQVAAERAAEHNPEPMPAWREIGPAPDELVALTVAKRAQDHLIAAHAPRAGARPSVEALRILSRATHVKNALSAMQGLVVVDFTAGMLNPPLGPMALCRGGVLYEQVESLIQVPKVRAVGPPPGNNGGAGRPPIVVR